MKKTLLTTLLTVASIYGTFAGDKVKLGIKLTPCFSFSKITDKKSDNTDYSRSGSTVRMIVGPFIDFAINDNVTFTTGLWYSPRAVYISAKTATTTLKSQYNLQYLMVPIYFKFYTNEIAPDMKLYFNLGGSLDFKIAEKKVGDDDAGLKTLAEKENKPLFNIVDASILMGTGVEFNLKDITNIYVGISYNRGLVNVINPLLEYTDSKGDKTKAYKDLSIKNNLLSLDLGVKF